MIPWKRAWPPTLVFLPREFHGQGSLAGYSPWGHKDSDMTERLSIHVSIHYSQTQTQTDRHRQTHRHTHTHTDRHRHRQTHRHRHTDTDTHRHTDTHIQTHTDTHTHTHTDTHTHTHTHGFPSGSDSKESASNVGDLGSIPGLARFSGEGNGYPV